MNGAVITNLGLLYIGTVMPKTMQTPLMSIFWAFFGRVFYLLGVFYLSGVFYLLGYCLLSGLASSRCLANVKSSIDEVVLDNRKLKVAK